MKLSANGIFKKVKEVFELEYVRVDDHGERISWRGETVYGLPSLEVLSKRMTNNTSFRDIFLEVKIKKVPLLDIGIYCTLDRELAEKIKEYSKKIVSESLRNKKIEKLLLEVEESVPKELHDKFPNITREEIEIKNNKLVTDLTISAQPTELRRYYNYLSLIGKHSIDEKINKLTVSYYPKGREGLAIELEKDNDKTKNILRVSVLKDLEIEEKFIDELLQCFF